jgi:hypothetical protein
MRRRRRYGIAVAVVVGITAKTIIVESQGAFPGSRDVLFGGTVEGVLAGWALDTLTRRLRKPKPGLVLLMLSGAIILEAAPNCYCVRGR